METLVQGTNDKGRHKRNSEMESSLCTSVNAWIVIVHKSFLYKRRKNRPGSHVIAHMGLESKLTAQKEIDK